MEIKDKKGLRQRIPCGQCIGCRLDKARHWATRCVHEAQMYEENCFITLTYNNKHLPTDKSIHKNEYQQFMKNLRKKTKAGIRFMACGEYGEDMGRPHYHACLFNYDFPDKQFWQFSKDGITPLYRSKILESIWKKGFSTIGEVTVESAGYVARYITKKITGKPAQKHYQNKIPEFALQSIGIGKTWIEKYYTDVYPKDYFTINGKKYKPSRYYDTYLEKRDPILYKKIKIHRKEALIHNLEENWQRLPQQENHKKLTTKSLQRSYEND